MGNPADTLFPFRELKSSREEMTNKYTRDKHDEGIRLSPSALPPVSISWHFPSFFIALIICE